MMNKFGSELRDFLIVKKISIKEFSNRIDTTSKNLIDILDGKIEISQNMIYNISFVTEIPVSYIENVESNFKIKKNIDKFLKKYDMTITKFINKFKYKEAEKKYNLILQDNRNDYVIARDILKYLRISKPDTLYKPDNSILYKSKNDKVELLSLWLEHCYRTIENQEINNYNKKNIQILVKYINEVAKKNIFCKKDLIKKFNYYGIYLAIEDDISGSKIRGAFKVLNDKPAIYITCKHKRYADIYFALLHELAHCKSDFNRAKSGSIVSFNDTTEEIDYEQKADNTAFNWMVNDEIYIKIKNNLNLLEELDVVKSFAVYRLAFDNAISYSSKLYQENNKIIEFNGTNKD